MTVALAIAKGCSNKADSQEEERVPGAMHCLVLVWNKKKKTEGLIVSGWFYSFVKSHKHSWAFAPACSLLICIYWYAMIGLMSSDFMVEHLKFKYVYPMYKEKKKV